LRIANRRPDPGFGFGFGKKEEASALLEQLLKNNPEDAGGLFTSISMGELT